MCANANAILITLTHMFTYKYKNKTAISPMQLDVSGVQIQQHTSIYSFGIRGCVWVSLVAQQLLNCIQLLKFTVAVCVLVSLLAHPLALWYNVKFWFCCVFFGAWVAIVSQLSCALKLALVVCCCLIQHTGKIRHLP